MPRLSSADDVDYVPHCDVAPKSSTTYYDMQRRRIGYYCKFPQHLVDFTGSEFFIGNSPGSVSRAVEYQIERHAESVGRHQTWSWTFDIDSLIAVRVESDAYDTRGAGTRFGYSSYLSSAECERIYAAVMRASASRRVAMDEKSGDCNHVTTSNSIRITGPQEENACFATSRIGKKEEELSMKIWVQQFANTGCTPSFAVHSSMDKVQKFWTGSTTLLGAPVQIVVALGPTSTASIQADMGVMESNLTELERAAVHDVLNSAEPTVKDNALDAGKRIAKAMARGGAMAAVDSFSDKALDFARVKLAPKYSFIDQLLETSAGRDIVKGMVAGIVIGVTSMKPDMRGAKLAGSVAELQLEGVAFKHMAPMIADIWELVAEWTTLAESLPEEVRGELEVGQGSNVTGMFAAAASKVAGG